MINQEGAGLVRSEVSAQVEEGGVDIPGGETAENRRKFTLGGVGEN